MNSAEEYYIHSLLEPDEVIAHGNNKRYGELKKERVLPGPVYIPVYIPEEEDNRRQDEYLASHGIDIKPKQA